MEAPSDGVPCVWVAASHRELGNENGKPQWYTVMDEGGTSALAELGLQPVCFARVPPARIATLLSQIDGVLLGGSVTNVHPRHYGESPAGPDLAYDEGRDGVTLPLARLALAAGVPLLGLCRGSHEINVALGGSLHQVLRRRPGGQVHWESPDESLDAQYAPRHEVTCVSSGELERLSGCQRFPVSSLHSQGLHRLGAGLVAEAHADDGLVEAFRAAGARRFAWGFQFHPEWGHQDHPRYARIMGAFVQACWDRLRERSRKES